MISLTELPVSPYAQNMWKCQMKILAQLKFEPSNHQVPLKDSIASKITEKIEVESTKQLKLEQPKLPVRLKDSNTVETAEEKEVASTMQVRFFSASVGKKSNVTTETARIGVRDHTGISSPQNGQKAWTCVICQSTLKSQIDINSHLQGKQHQKACALLNSKNQASNSNAASASARKKTEIPVNNPKKCVISNNTSPENKIHEAKKQGRQENPMKSLLVEIKNSKWWCALCNVSCTSEADMACQLRGNKHLDSRISRWQCTICDVSCTSEADMACHLRGNKHLDSRISRWQCTICDVSCTSEGDLHCHLNGNKLLSRIQKMLL
ncbi:hypothetical protein DKX38_024937 [Salix brachista]|uniref:C2H2-type domain-containing protein n=1 Tax=Salix brachista TaxID=2182728 RepID=A0A5N5JMP8_9ROSI|nr:hypothetical protein DKX38_024937 [Salix brachista]